MKGQIWMQTKTFILQITHLDIIDTVHEGHVLVYYNRAVSYI